MYLEVRFTHQGIGYNQANSQTMSTTLDFSDPVDPVEEKRRLIFGALMLYSAEAIPLRERALEAAVLAGLVGSTADRPMKNGDLQRLLRAGIGEIDLRPEVIRETLNRLIAKDLVRSFERMLKPVYHLTEIGEARTRQGTSEVHSLFEPVMVEILADGDDGLDKAQAAAVSKEFICTAFARYGSSIANDLVGRRTRFANSVELSITFDEIAARRFVPSGARESLKVRCLAIFRAKSLAAHRLILHLTQGYCFAQLLGADRATFNPITDEAFKASVFYLDTNVLFAGLLPGDNGAAFGEVLGIARRVGAELRVTRATIDETRHTAAEKLATLTKIVEGAVPDEVGERSSDEFVAHFYTARQSKPSLQPSEFLANFHDVAVVARGRWGVVVEEATEEAMLEGIDIEGIGAFIQAATVAARGWPKSLHVLRHDVAHLSLIRSSRNALQKTWFLTRDNSLISAAEELARAGADARPLCFGLLGFLQSISPFVTTSTEDSVLANFFSGLLTDQIFVPEKLFDDRELALISETHSDVMTMPPEQVVVAVDYVKRHVLKGERYNTEKIPVVALELRKYLSANTEDRRRAMQSVADEATQKYEVARQTMLRERALREDYERRLQRAEDDLEKSSAVTSAQQEAIEKIKRAQTTEIEGFRQRDRARDLRQRRLLAVVVGVAAWLGLRHYGDVVTAGAGSIWHLAPDSLRAAAVVLRFLKVGFLIMPILLFIPRNKNRPEIQTALVALVVIAWLTLAGVQLSSTVSGLSNAATIALYVALFFAEKRS